MESCTLSVSNTIIDLIEYEGFLKLDGKVQKSVQSGRPLFELIIFITVITNQSKKYSIRINEWAALFFYSLCC